MTASRPTCEIRNLTPATYFPHLQRLCKPTSPTPADVLAALWKGSSNAQDLLPGLPSNFYAFFLKSYILLALPMSPEGLLPSLLWPVLFSVERLLSRGLHRVKGVTQRRHSVQLNSVLIGILPTSNTVCVLFFNRKVSDIVRDPTNTFCVHTEHWYFQPHLISVQLPWENFWCARFKCPRFLRWHALRMGIHVSQAQVSRFLSSEIKPSSLISLPWREKLRETSLLSIKQECKRTTENPPTRNFTVLSEAPTFSLPSESY